MLSVHFWLSTPNSRRALDPTIVVSLGFETRFRRLSSLCRGGPPLMYSPHSGSEGGEGTRVSGRRAAHRGRRVAYICGAGVGRSSKNNAGF